MEKRACLLIRDNLVDELLYACLKKRPQRVVIKVVHHIHRKEHVQQVDISEATIQPSDVERQGHSWEHLAIQSYEHGLADLYDECKRGGQELAIATFTTVSP